MFDVLAKEIEDSHKAFLSMEVDSQIEMDHPGAEGSKILVSRIDAKDDELNSVFTVLGLMKGTVLGFVEQDGEISFSEQLSRDLTESFNANAAEHKRSTETT